VNKSNLLTAGLIAYLCEGTKLRKDPRYNNTYHYVIEFTNSDPNLIKLFLNFLRQEIGINENKLKCQLSIYDNQKMNEIEIFWSDLLKISLSNFNKTYIFKPKNIKNKMLLRGTCKLRYHDKKSFLKLNELIIENIGSQFNLVK
jgi:hypothetical protein